MAAKLPPGTTLAQWYHANEPLLQEGPSEQERIRIVAAALLPLFEAACLLGGDPVLDDDFSHGTFFESLAGWHARVPGNAAPSCGGSPGSSGWGSQGIGARVDGRPKTYRRRTPRA